MKYEEAGAVLALSGKTDAYTFLKSALAPRFRRILHMSNIAEARQCIGRERVVMTFVFSPLGDGNGLDFVTELSDRKEIASVLVVKPEIYQEAMYKSQGRRIFVLTYPTQKGLLSQTANLIYQTQLQLYKAALERDRLKIRLADLAVVSRVKCLLIERQHMTENEAHHYIERKAMDFGLTKRKAAECVLNEMGEQEA